MKSLVLKKWNMSMLTLLLAFSSSAFSAVETPDEIAEFKKSCTAEWQKEIKGEVTADNKRFGANFCDCFTDEYVNFMKTNNAKEPSSAEENTLSDFCINKSLLHKTVDKVKQEKNIDAALVESTCKQIYATINSQVEGPADTTKRSFLRTKNDSAQVDDDTIKFCQCASTQLSQAMSSTLSDAELTKKIDKTAEGCTPA